jgi:glycosyltransferase involved in cell wall biosynthesis
MPEAAQIRVLDYGPPWFPTRAYTGDRFVRFHNYLWQIGTYFLIWRRLAEIRPDVIHHITWGVFRQPSFLCLFNIPFVFGPIGGGEEVPFRLRYKFSWRAHAFEFIRDIINRTVLIDPLMSMTFRRSALIATKTPETARKIPHRFRHKVINFLELGVHPTAIRPRDASPSKAPGATFRIVFAGRMIHWKGIYLVVAAYARLRRRNPNAQLTMVGGGEDRGRLKRFAAELGVADDITWVDWIDHHCVAEVYRQHDICLFPSLHDSSGNVPLEAMSHGLPVVSLDLGGPSMFIDNSCGRLVSTAGLSASQVIDALAEALDELGDPELRALLSDGAIRKAESFAWERRVQQFYTLVSEAIRKPYRVSSTAVGSIAANRAE